MVFQDRVSLCGFGACPGTSSADQAGLELIEICLPSARIKEVHHHRPACSGLKNKIKGLPLDKMTLFAICVVSTQTHFSLHMVAVACSKIMCALKQMYK